MSNSRLQRNILQCILLISLATAVLAVLAVGNMEMNCPSNCQCTSDLKTNFTIDCQGRQDVNSEQLSQQLDSLLSSNLTYGHLIWLSIINTPLTHVPRSICRLTTLTHLYLDNNQLIQLSDDCFPHLKHLTIISASQNKIQTLQNGLFDGLQELVSLNFSENHIYEIGLIVFSNESDMISLRHIDLSYNNLTSIEPWPLVRGQLGSEKAVVTIRLDRNRISTFTNNIRWKANCSAKPVFLEVDMSWNQIQHLMDVADGWDIKSFSELCILRLHHGLPNIRVFFRAASFACDCVDYPIYQYTYSYTELASMFHNFLQNTYCSSEHSHLRYRLITAVPLDQFVCELRECCPLGCRCVYRPANATLHVYCSNTNLSVLPLELPALPENLTKYHLNFSDNQLLHRLEYRDYFVNISVLDISNCSIDEIPLNIWNDISIIKTVCFYGNPFTSLHANVIAVYVSPSLHNICLDRNQLLHLDERCPPGCRCVYRPSSATLDIECTNTDLAVLPLELPALPKSYTTYKLDFSNNRLLHRLEHRDYFINTSVLDISDCVIDDISLDVWKDISVVKIVLVDENSLKSLPLDAVSASLLTLDRNRWACLCENTWMVLWLHQINRSMANVDGLLCGSLERLSWKNIMEISTEELCHDPVTEDRALRALLISLSVSSVVGIAAVLMSVGVIVRLLRVKLNITWKFHPLGRDECLGEDMDYDVFISCSSNDNLPHGNDIRERLEQCGYRVCYPPRDFVAGELIFVNIDNAVARSKRTVCLLTPHFLQR